MVIELSQYDDLFQPLGVGMIIGGTRNNKSALLVLMMRVAALLGYDIYTNMKLKPAFFKGIKGKVHYLDPDDREHCLEQVSILVDYIDQDKSYDIRRFLGLDELKDLLPAQEWKINVSSSQNWTQGGKVGLTIWGTAQTYDMVYNHYRWLCGRRIVSHKSSPGESSYIYEVFTQNPVYKELYDEYDIGEADSRDVWDMYYTHQLMYH